MFKTGDRVIVRTYSAGVFMGTIGDINKSGKKVVLLGARRLWYWSGAASLSQIAESGVTDPDNCKFPMPVDKILLTEVIEILSVTDTAWKNVADVKVWKA
jgi:hypothetical protein